MFIFLAVQLQILVRAYSAMFHIKVASPWRATAYTCNASHIKRAHKYGKTNGENKRNTQRRPILHEH